MSSAHVPIIASGNVRPGSALVLAGGGMRVAYQAGVVKALFDAGKRFSHADGASGGTINLAALMSGISPDDLCNRWRAMPVSYFAALRPAAEYLRLGQMKAFGSSSGLKEKVYPALGIALNKVNAAQGIDASFNVCRFDDKTIVPIPHTQLDVDRLVAAVSLPIFMPAVEAEGSIWSDAVWIKDANLLSCVARGANDLWLVWCIGNTKVYRNGAFNQYVHMIEMSAIGALNWELEAIADINRRISLGEMVSGHTTPIVVHVVKPEVPLPLDPDFFFGRIDASTLVDMGYRDGHKALKLGPAPLDSRATLMREPGVGVSFRETMSGEIELNPAGVAALGSASALAMHATIHIDDIRKFVASEDHQSDLTGHLDFQPLGQALPATTGVFGLFAPSGDPSLVYMVYELGFCHSGRDYYLAGRKHLRIGWPWKLWRETTTLYVDLHEGPGRQGNVLGSGTLRLGARDLFRLLRTVHSTNSWRTSEGIKAVAAFFRFFSLELMRIYIMRKTK